MSRHVLGHEQCAVCFIIPPRVLKRLASQARNDADREHLLETLALTEQLRGQRNFMPLAARSKSTGELRRTVYDAHHRTTLPGKLVLAEGGTPPTTAAGAPVKEAYDNAGLAYRFYEQVFQRNSVDDRGLRLDSTVHFARQYDNAFWNGDQMVYGDGHMFHDFTGAVDVVVHELTHGVTQYVVPGGGLLYQGQSGALNESMSDCFGSMAKQWNKKQTVASADWKIGDSIVPDGSPPLRSMSEPEKGFDPQPSRMSDFVDTGDDNGGVHTNSGIPNHAFYLACKNLGPNTKSWEAAGRIWYRGLSMLKATSDFKEAAQAFVHAALLIFGANSTQMKAVADAWAAVGVLEHTKV
jgi:Zn-dependent metalloprotease